jgi:hypothetical protein
MKMGSGGSRFGLSAAAVVALVGCLHCSDDENASPATGGSNAGASGEGGSPTKGGTSAGTAGSTAGSGGSSGSGGAPQVMAGAPSSDGGAGGAAGGGSDEGGVGGAGVAGSGDAGAGGDVGGGAGGAGGDPGVEVFGFVFDKVVMPTSNAEADAVGFDLNDDQVVDNKFGRAMSQLIAMGFFVNPSLNTAVQKGTLLMLGRLDATSLSSAEGASFSTYFGSDANPAPCAAPNDCGKHLAGTGTFSIADDNLAANACIGDITSAVFSGEGGDLPMRLVLGIEKADVVLHDARVELSALSADGFSSGRIGGAISEADVNGELYPAVHNTIVADVALSCTGTPAPTCGCSPNTNGAVFIAAIDTNHDCAITLEEVKANETISGLFALDLDRDDDLTPDALSCGFVVGGKKATFALP